MTQYKNDVFYISQRNDCIMYQEHSPKIKTFSQIIQGQVCGHGTQKNSRFVLGMKTELVYYVYVILTQKIICTSWICFRLTEGIEDLCRVYKSDYGVEIFFDVGDSNASGMFFLAETSKKHAY